MEFLLALQPSVTFGGSIVYHLAVVRPSRTRKPLPTGTGHAAQRGVQVDVVLAQAEQAAVITLVGGKVRPIVLGIQLGHGQCIGCKAQLRGSRQQLIGTAEVLPTGVNPMVQRHVLIIQVYGSRPFAERARTSPARPHNGSVQPKLIHRAIILRLQRQNGRECPTILHWCAARSQVYPAEQEGGVTATGRGTDAHRSVGHQYVHTVDVGLRLSVVASAHQQAARLTLHLRARQGLECSVEVTVRSAYRNQFHGMQVAPPAIGRRRAPTLHHHFVQPHAVRHRHAVQDQADGVGHGNLRVGIRGDCSSQYHQNKE